MNLVEAYQAINKSTLHVVESINVLTSPSSQEEEQYVRLVESPLVVTDAMRRTCKVVTAHDLGQYKTQFHSIKLKDDVTSWLLDLLKIDEGENYVCY